eukprot:TRINITY_DN12979_c0_g2_i1.p1 TRINITY_DN12979_c0_g2~~TRINITY_DN12979_c0_g2_i1.p1  ORF type:complete len:349 (+),score=25.79 TRINITY_DN12979_c0_g2_i1:26-1072(+)
MKIIFVLSFCALGVSATFARGLGRAASLANVNVTQNLLRNLRELESAHGCHKATAALVPPDPTSPLSFWQLYHSGEASGQLYNCSYCRIVRLAGPTEFLGNGRGLDVVALLPDVAGTALQPLVAEALGLVALGSLAASPCTAQHPKWMGTGSWKMLLKSRPLPCGRMRNFEWGRLGNHTAVYWFGARNQLTHCSRALPYPFIARPGLRTYIVLHNIFFSELFGIHPAQHSCPNSCGLVYANYFIVTRPVFASLGRLMTLAIAWLLDRVEMNCNDYMWRSEFFGENRERCWAFFLENVAIQFFCSLVPKVAVWGCTPGRFSPAYCRQPSNFSLAAIDQLYFTLQQAAAQ